MEENEYLRTENIGVMPAFVRYDSNLSTGAKFFYCEFMAQKNAENCCELRDVEFAEILNVTETTIKNWVRELIKFGYLKREMVYYKQTKQIVARKLIIKI